MTERDFGRRGRRGAEAPAKRRGAARVSDWLGLDAARADGAPAIVPTTVRGVALASVGLFVLQFAILLAQRQANGVAGMAATASPAGMVLVPPGRVLYAFSIFLWTLAVGAVQIAAVYALIGHAVLRWLRASSILAYALGGCAVAYVFLAIWAIDGQHLHWRGALIELAGGALVGGLYRIGSGLAGRPDVPSAAA